MATLRHNVSAQPDFTRTGRMAGIAFLVAAVLVTIVALLTVAYLSSRDSTESGIGSGKPQPEQRMR